MGSCCEDKACDIAALKESQGRVLVIVLVINAVMFVVEMTAGIIANSTALLADSLDMFGDALVYGFSLYVINRDDSWQAMAALFKGAIMAAFGIFVLTEAVYKIAMPMVPVAETMGIVGLLALAANLACLRLLWTHRGDNLNMSSVWLCSRNDIIANTGVLIAAVGVWAIQSRWPDIIIGVVIAGIFLRSAVHVIGSSVQQLRASRA
ncbi:MAG: cation efflux protein [Gammaproteobacteria bacterium]|nr:MAG: cation efflux protein [Gammaproteobacteria bacterium]TND01497.1 MAG: cation efflux protein [Gammaproteobacteria bacterium]